MTIKEAFERYCEDVIQYKNQSLRTKESHRQVCEKFIKYAGNIDVLEITFELIRTWKLSLEAEGLATNTIRLYIIKIRNVLKYLRLRDIPCLKYQLVDVPKRDSRPPVIATEQEIEKMIHSTSLLRNKAIIALLFASGIRVSELCRLNRGDIRDKTFSVYGKCGKARPCFIDQRAKYYLELYLKERKDNLPPLFLNQAHGRMTPKKVQDMFIYVRKAAGITKPIHPHTMRHSYATNLMKNGCHIYSLSRLMGHSDIQTTAIYLTLEDPELKEVYNKYHTTK